MVLNFFFLLLVLFAVVIVVAAVFVAIRIIIINTCDAHTTCNDDPEELPTGCGGRCSGWNSRV